jgi:bifunctional DNase/RNase
MWIGASEATAIAAGLQNEAGREPLTHDFICSIITSLGAVLEYVVVHELKGETYRAKADLETAGKPVEIDCRPSDGLATPLEQAHRYLPLRRF